MSPFFVRLLFCNTFEDALTRRETILFPLLCSLKSRVPVRVADSNFVPDIMQSVKKFGGTLGHISR